MPTLMSSRQIPIAPLTGALRRASLALLVGAALLLPWAVEHGWAQSGAFGQTYTSEVFGGSLTVQPPAGWHVREWPRFVRITSNPDLVEAQEPQLAFGDVTIDFVTVPTAVLGDQIPREQLTARLLLTNDMPASRVAELEILDINLYPWDAAGFRADATGQPRMVVVALPDLDRLYAVELRGDFDSQWDTVLAVLRSIDYVPGEQVMAAQGG